MIREGMITESVACMSLLRRKPHEEPLQPQCTELPRQESSQWGLGQESAWCIACDLYSEWMCTTRPAKATLQLNVSINQQFTYVFLPLMSAKSILTVMSSHCIQQELGNRPLCSVPQAGPILINAASLCTKCHNQDQYWVTADRPGPADAGQSARQVTGNWPIQPDCEWLAGHSCRASLNFKVVSFASRHCHGMRHCSHSPMCTLARRSYLGWRRFCICPLPQAGALMNGGLATAVNSNTHKLYWYNGMLPPRLLFDREGRLVHQTSTTLRTSSHPTRRGMRNCKVRRLSAVSTLSILQAGESPPPC